MVIGDVVFSGNVMMFMDLDMDGNSVINFDWVYVNDLYVYSNLNGIIVKLMQFIIYDFDIVGYVVINLSGVVN